MFGFPKPDYKYAFEQCLVPNITKRSEMTGIPTDTDTLKEECLMFSMDMCLEFLEKSGGLLTKDWIEHITNETGSVIANNYPNLFDEGCTADVLNKVLLQMRNPIQAKERVDRYYRRTILKLIEALRNGDNNPLDEIVAFDFNDHIRYQNGIDVSGHNYGCNRQLEIKKNQMGQGYIVTIYNLDGNHPFWGNNIHMAPKQMIITNHSNNFVKLIGFGTDMLGGRFSDYSIELFFNAFEKYKLDRFKLLMLDRNITIEYLNN